MHQVTLSDRDILILKYALRTFMLAVEAARSSWQDEDYDAAQTLAAEFAALADADRELRRNANAENHHRSE
jgi:hypothetical protein